MKNQLISINAVSHITGYKPGELMLMNACGDFPCSVTKHKGVLMYSLDDITEWNEINRQRLIPAKYVACLLNISINELIALDEKCAGFPLPVERNRNISFSKWINGEILDWRKKFWKSF